MHIETLVALLRRIPAFHSERAQIEDELSIQQAGLAGEKSLTYTLSYLPEKEYQILPKIRLENPPYFFQIDYLIICPRFLLILEVKNYGGQLYFDSHFNQLIQKKDGKEKAYPNPLIQVQRQKDHLKDWFSKHRISDIPLETLIVISNPYTIIKANPQYKLVFEKVLHKEHVLSKIEMFNGVHTKPALSHRKIKRIAELIKAQHTPYIPNVLNRYNIKEVTTGVHCPQCNAIPMLYKNANWHCLKCKHTSKTAYLAALKDYALLIKPMITNQECRRFLHLPNVNSANYLLSKLNLSYTGETKGRQYYLKFEEFLN